VFSHLHLKTAPGINVLSSVCAKLVKRVDYHWTKPQICVFVLVPRREKKKSVVMAHEFGRSRNEKVVAYFKEL
jgi:hypothetical protein